VKERLAVQRVLAATLAFALAPHAERIAAQIAPSKAQKQIPQTQLSPSASRLPQAQLMENDHSSFSALNPEFLLPSQGLFDVKDSDIKFQLEELMDILRGTGHESWVLAAYPDPKTDRPLIGAGFNLDVGATQHIQRNPFNAYQFVEPSTAQLWQAAGLDLARLQSIRDQFDRDMERWTKKEFRQKIRAHELPPQLTEEEGARLLRISVLQAVHNARAYCDDFDHMTASQQMAMSQLVFQMGINLEEFVQFLSAINHDYSFRDSRRMDPETEEEHWRRVQRTLILSDWARRYTSRAVAVIAMFDPNYDENPREAEREVRVQVRPLVRHHHRPSPRSRAVRHSVPRQRQKPSTGSAGYVDVLFHRLPFAMAARNLSDPALWSKRVLLWSSGVFADRTFYKFLIRPARHRTVISASVIRKEFLLACEIRGRHHEI